MLEIESVTKTQRRLRCRKISTDLYAGVGGGMPFSIIQQQIDSRFLFYLLFLFVVSRHSRVFAMQITT